MYCVKFALLRKKKWVFIYLVKIYINNDIGKQNLSSGDICVYKKITINSYRSAQIEYFWSKNYSSSKKI